MAHARATRTRDRDADSDHEPLGIAYAQERADLCDAVDATIEALRESGEFAKLQAAWPGTGAAV